MSTVQKILVGAGIGAVLGYAYYYFIGCNGGTCPLTSTWYVTTLYGAGIGLMWGIPTRKKEKDIEENTKER